MRRLLRGIGWTASVCWGLLVLVASVSLYRDPTYDWDPVLSVLAAVVMLSPSLAFWLFQWARSRRRREAQPAEQQQDAAARVHRTSAASADLSRLPASVRQEWRRLLQARDLVHEIADQGWVDRSALLDVDDHVARLYRLLEADERTIRLGGAPATTLVDQVEQLRALLVALADEAVEQQASFAGDDVVPVTLAEARDRLAATTRAYREMRRSRADTVPGGEEAGSVR